MKTLKKTRRWGCLATSFAMALGMTEEMFYRVLGHDGGEITANGLGDDPRARRGIHVQEAIYVARECGRHVTPIELIPTIRTVANQVLPVYFHGDSRNNLERFEFVIKHGAGVVTGDQHAMAFRRGMFHDPDDGTAFPYSLETCQQRKFHPQCLWHIT